MPDESGAALAKRRAIQSVVRDGSLIGVQRNKKIMDIMAGKMEFPEAVVKQPPPKPVRVDPKRKPQASRGGRDSQRTTREEGSKSSRRKSNQSTSSR